LIRLHPGFRCVGEELSKGPPHISIATSVFRLTAPAHRGILFRDTEQLKPNALGLQGAAEELGGKAWTRDLAAQQRRDLRLMPSHYGDQKPKEELR